MLESEKICYRCLEESILPRLRKDGYSFEGISNSDGGCRFIVVKNGKKSTVLCGCLSSGDCKFQLERTILLGHHK